VALCRGQHEVVGVGAGLEQQVQQRLD